MPTFGNGDDGGILALLDGGGHGSHLALPASANDENVFSFLSPIIPPILGGRVGGRHKNVEDPMLV